MTWTWRMCPQCHCDAFHLRADERLARTQLVCGGCKAVLIDNQPPLPATPPPPQSTLNPI